MKKLSGTLKLDLAQYRELEAFAKFGSDLDAATQAQLRRGERTVELLKQDVYKPLPVEQQIVLLKVNSDGLLDKLSVEQIRAFEDQFLESLTVKCPVEMEEVAKKGILGDHFGSTVLEIAQSVIGQFRAGDNE